MLKERIRSHLLDSGADLVGFADISGLNVPEYAGFSIAISIGVKLFDAVIDTITDSPTYMYYHHYDATNRKLDQIALSGGTYLEDLGFKVFPVAASQMNPHDKDSLSAFFSHKTAARLAGLGHIGKSALMITKAYGPRVRFCTLLTNLDVEADTPITQSLCGNCTACAQACPAQAISGNHYEPGDARSSVYDAHKCHDLIKTRFQVSGNGVVCGICVQCCPLGKIKSSQ